MPNRTGTYIAFYANNTRQPTESDIKYYNLLKAWDENDDISFEFVNSHDKGVVVSDNVKKASLVSDLKRRLLRSKHMILIIGKTTKEDTDWVPFEIKYAVDECNIPIIAVYPGYEYITNPIELSHLWPDALKLRIENKTCRVIHIPFKKEPIFDAMSQFTHNNHPNTPVSYYPVAVYKSWGFSIK